MGNSIMNNHTGIKFEFIYYEDDKFQEYKKFISRKTKLKDAINDFFESKCKIFDIDSEVKVYKSERESFLINIAFFFDWDGKPYIEDKFFD